MRHRPLSALSWLARLLVYSSPHCWPDGLIEVAMNRHGAALVLALLLLLLLINSCARADECCLAESRCRCPWSLTPYADELTIPPIVALPSGEPFRLVMSEAQHRFHSQLPRTTTVWAYNGVVPGPVLVAESNRSAQIELINSLPLRQHPLERSLDTCVEGAW